METHIEVVAWIAGGGNYVVTRAGEFLQEGAILSARHPTGREATANELVGLTRYCDAIWDMPFPH